MRCEDFAAWAKGDFKDRVAKNKLGFSGFEDIWLLFNIVFVQHLSCSEHVTDKPRSEGFCPLNVEKMGLSSQQSGMGKQMGKDNQTLQLQDCVFVHSIISALQGVLLVACCLCFTIYLSLTWLPSEMRLKQPHAQQEHLSVCQSSQEPF